MGSFRGLRTGCFCPRGANSIRISPACPSADCWPDANSTPPPNQADSTSLPETKEQFAVPGAQTHAPGFAQTHVSAGNHPPERVIRRQIRDGMLGHKCPACTVDLHRFQAKLPGLFGDRPGARHQVRGLPARRLDVNLGGEPQLIALGIVAGTARRALPPAEGGTPLAQGTPPLPSSDRRSSPRREDGAPPPFL